MPKTCAVYKLIDPDTGETKYVGQTRCKPHKRLHFHFVAVRRKVHKKERLSPVQNWLHILQQKGTKPRIEIIDNKAIWDITEAVWIDRLRQQGDGLLNISSVVD